MKQLVEDTMMKRKMISRKKRMKMMIMEKLKVLLMEAKMMKVVKIEISNKKEMHNNSLVSTSKKET